LKPVYKKTKVLNRDEWVGLQFLCNFGVKKESVI